MVLGVGNTLLADDGVGVRVVRRLVADAETPAWANAVDGGTMGFRLIGLLRNASDMLIIDAAQIGAPAGAMRLLDGAALSAHTASSQRTSAHEAGLADLLTLLRLEDAGLSHLAVLAIQPLTVDWGETLSDAVALAVGPACDMINQILTQWRRG